MLEVVKERKEGKKDRERREKEERKEGRDKIRRERERRKRGGSSEDEVVGPKVFDSSGGLMEINGYAKRGGVREWDQGKVN